MSEESGDMANNIKSSKITIGAKRVHFVKWYNEVFLKDKEIAGDARRTNPIHKDNKFAEIFDQTKMWYAPELTLNEFVAFFMIFCNETGGYLKPLAEFGEKGDAGKYFFEPRKGVKVSYNDGKMNRLAGDLLVAMKVLKEDDDKAIKAWNGQAWPKDASDEVKKASLECDYHKYRGRGIIQTTWRSNYHAHVDPLLKGKKCDQLTDEELTKAVCENPEVYLGMVKRFFSGPKWAATIAALNVEPPKTPGFYEVGHHVSGGSAYGKKYEWRCQTLLAAINDAGYEAK